MFREMFELIRGFFAVFLLVIERNEARHELAPGGLKPHATDHRERCSHHMVSISRSPRIDNRVGVDCFMRDAFDA